MVWLSHRRVERFRAAHVLLVMAVLAMPRICAAQDDRTDDPPAREGTIQVSDTAATTPSGWWSEPSIIGQSIQFAVDKFEGQGKDKNGWYLEMSNMITGSGWISLGPGYRKQMFNNKAFADVSAAASWHLYKMVQGRFEAPDLTSHHLTLGAQAMWQDETQVHYFGLGPNSLQSDESQYRMRSRDFVGYAAWRPATSLTVSGAFGWLHSPDLSDPAGTFKPSFPPTTEVFPLDPGVTPSSQPSYLHSEIAVTGDTRDYRGHPTRGGMYRVAMTNYADQRDGVFSFRQYEAEAAHFTRITGPKWILVLHGWVAADDVSSGHEVPVYLLPTLGGSNTLRSFHTYRFHDRSLALVNVESRWAITTHVDAAAFFDAGNVAHNAADLTLGKTSAGAGLRLHTQRTTFARLDVAHGSEGWQVVVRTNDPFRFSRLTRRVADLPFVP